MMTFLGDAHFEGDAVAGNKIIQSPVVPPEPPRQLPLNISGFAGRAETLAQLDGLVNDTGAVSATAIIAITGMPGIGKTALAVHWAHRIADQFPDGHLFIDLRGYADRAALSPREALEQALRALGVPSRRIPADDDELAALYRSQLATRKILVILDDAVNSQQVHSLLPGSPSCLAIVTSRSDLGGLVAKADARIVALDLLPAAEALDLVRTVVGRARTEAEPEASAQLVRACARLPLALRIAAASLATRPQQTVADTAQALAEGNRLSSLALGEDPDNAVRSAFDLSYRDLGDETRRAFRLLGLIEGPTFTPDAMGALFGVTPAAARHILGWLETANLVQAVARDRYQIHELLREYARERGYAEDDTEVRTSALQRLVTWYLSAAQQAGRFLERHRRTIRQELVAPSADVSRTERARHVEWFQLEHLNLIAVIEQASRLLWNQLTWELADAVYDFLELRRHCHDNIAVHRLGLRAAQRERHHLAQFFMHYHISLSNRELGQYREAFVEGHRALEISRQIQDRYGEAAALDNLARIHFSVGKFKEALGAAREALMIWRKLGDRHGEAGTRDTLARVSLGLSEYQDALEQTKQALNIRHEIGDMRGEAETLDNMARIYRGWGRHGEALNYAKRALIIRGITGDRHGQAETLAFLGVLHVWLGKFALAQDYVDRALKICKETADRHGEGRALEHLSVIHRRLGRYDDAMQTALEALDILQELGDPYGETEALIALTRAQARLGLYEGSIRDAKRALDISRKTGDRFNEAVTLDALAVIHRKLGHTKLALEHVERSLSIRREINDRRGEGMALDTLCKVHRTMGHHETALQVALSALLVETEVEDHFGRSVTLSAIGLIYADRGQLDRAIRYLRQALDVKREIGDHPGEAITLRRLSVLLDRQGRAADARECMEKAQQIEEESQFDLILVDSDDLGISPPRRT